MEAFRGRILIVEDDEPTAAGYRRVLEETGECQISEQFEQVGWAISDFMPHLILLDIILEGDKNYPPEQAGIEILRKIRQTRALFIKELPVIVITGAIDPEIETKCRVLGATDFFRKPVDPEVLREAAKKALSRQFRPYVIKVFISSPMNELEGERQTVMQAIQDLGSEYKPDMAEIWGGCTDPVAKIWRRAAEECDIFVLILGKRYGRVLPGTIISATEDEYNRARATGKPILAFVKKVPKQQRDPKLLALLTRLYDPNTGHLVKHFEEEDFDGLRAQVQEAIRDATMKMNRASDLPK